MFTSIVFTAVLASSAVLLSHAEVTPNEPGPGESFNQGAQCHIAWNGDTTGSKAWKNMAIQLMTGSNEKMTPLTTVAQNQDGTVDGTFDYDCPAVTPNSPIYFYQFVSGATDDITWTTRFTIAGTDGSSTPATQTEKTSDGQTVGIGNGALVDPSTAVPPPTFNSTSSGSSSASGGSIASASTGGTSAGSPSASGAAPSGTGSPSAGAPVKPSGPAGQTSAPANSSGGASNSASAPKQSGSSAAVAVGPMVMDTRMWPFVAALTACATAFTILL